MDKLIIKDLEVYGYHGVNKEEKFLGQKFLISLELYMSLREAGKSDDLNNTVNYAELCKSVESEFLKEKYDLIEKCAEHIAEFILSHYNMIKGVKVNIKKPWAPIGKPVAYAAVEIERSWHTAYIGIGSNMGDVGKNIQLAIEKVNNVRNTEVIKKSENYKTKPVGYTEQEDFLNCAIEIKTLCTPSELINILLYIESELKRERTIKWGPRTIDLDILLYDDLITSEEKIVIPHPRMHKRLFALKPLCDIAPYAVHPLLKKRIIDLTEEVSKTQSLL